MIGIYDKGKSETGSTFIQNVKKSAKRATKTCSRLQDLQTCEIAISHIFDEEWGSLIEDYSCPNDVRVRVSVGSKLLDEPPPKKKSGVYIFYLVEQAGTLKKGEWKKILSGLSDPEIVEDLVAGKDRNGLRRFFVTEKVLSDWETRRSEFKHDWLQNEFLNRFGYFIELAQREEHKSHHLDKANKFLKKDFPAWEDRRQEAQGIVQSFEENMSSRGLLSSSPLVNDAKESQDALEAVNKIYDKIAGELKRFRPPIDSPKLIALCPQFCELKEAYDAFSTTLSKLTEEV